MDESDKLRNKQASLGLRESVFKTKITDLQGVQPLGDYRIFGAIMEMGHAQGFATIACFITGDASIYFSNGGGMLGGINHQIVRDATLKFIQSSLNFITMFKRTDVHPFPKAEQDHFYILSQDGVYAAQALTNDLGNKRSELSPLFFAGQDVITAYRMIKPMMEEY